MLRTLVLAAALSTLPAARPQDPQGPRRDLTPQERELVARLAEQQVQLDPLGGWCSIPAEIDVRDDLLEYLLVGPGGAAHESAFTTPVTASVLNVALIALGVERGTNAEWRATEPRPTEEELRAGASPYQVTVPKGDGFFLYAGWRAAGETYFFRVDDLIRNLGTGQSMQRHEWVYLGSRMVPGGKSGAPEQFAADIYQNYINIAFFHEGYTLLTGALPECVDQTVWMLNAWLVPERGSRVALVLSRSRLEAPTPEIARLLPELEPSASAPNRGR